MESAQIDRKVKRGTIVAAECCYGAQLFDPSIPGDMGICNRYLAQGAYAFFGSSTIAYGPSEGNGAADWVCQFYIERVLNGASTGRAALEARIGFIWFATHLDPMDLKTLAQFNLMGDPSITAVGKPTHKLQRTKVFHAAFDGRPDAVARTLRRKRLRREGLTLSSTVGAARGAKDLRAPAKVRKALEASVRNADLKPGAAASFTVDDPAISTLGRRIADTTPSTFHITAGIFDERRGVAKASRRRGRDSDGRRNRPPEAVAPARMKIRGRVERRLIGRGSKSEHNAVVLVTAEHATPYEDAVDTRFRIPCSMIWSARNSSLKANSTITFCTLPGGGREEFRNRKSHHRDTEGTERIGAFPLCALCVSVVRFPVPNSSPSLSDPWQRRLESISTLHQGIPLERIRRTGQRAIRTRKESIGSD